VAEKAFGEKEGQGNQMTKLNKWTNSERQLLRELYESGAPLDMICERIPRHTLASIKPTAHAMGLRRPNRYLAISQSYKFNSYRFQL